jgi:hypothetical protein
MLFPLRREALRDRARLDEADEATAYEQMTPSQRIERSLELSELAAELARAVGGAWVDQARVGLQEKMRLYVAPMRAARR